MRLGFMFLAMMQGIPTVSGCGQSIRVLFCGNAAPLPLASPLVRFGCHPPPFQPLTAKRTSGLSAVFVLVTGDLRFDPDLVRLTKDQYGGAKCDTAVLSAI